MLNATRDSHKIKREAQLALLLDTHKEQIDTSRGTLQAEIEELLKSQDDEMTKLKDAGIEQKHSDFQMNSQQTSLRNRHAKAKDEMEQQHKEKLKALDSAKASAVTKLKEALLQDLNRLCEQ